LSFVEERDDKGRLKQQCRIYRKKQWRTFKAQDATSTSFMQGAEEECHWCSQQVLEVLAVR
jgi:hypothetical protein